MKYKEQFYNINYGFKREGNKRNIELIKNETIGNIISIQKISTKYKIIKDNEQLNLNNIIINEFTKDNKKMNKVINNILSENYLDFFLNIYYPSKRKISFKKYGLDKEILLSNKVKMFKDFQLKDVKRDKGKNYQENINFIIDYLKVLRKK